MIVQCDKLSVGYDGKCIASNINFSIFDKGCMCVVGENGVGKSTLIKTLIRVLQPLSGDLRISGRIGYLPQRAEIKADFPATAKEVILSGMQSHTKLFYSKSDKDTAAYYATTLNVSPVMLTQQFSKLSGGQQQRVLLARALCATDDVLILDEPITGLDIESVSIIYNIIDEVKKSKIVIMISHDIQEATKHADWILEMHKDGSRVQDVG